MKESAKIVLLCVAAAILYGIAHDQITARICVEYFTIAHPAIVRTDDPTVLGLVWGVIATWWAGLGLGVLLAAATRYGERSKRTVGSLLGVVGALLAAMALLAGLAGTLAWFMAGAGWLPLLPPWDDRVPAEQHQAFLAVAAAHSTSYAVAGLGGCLSCWRVWRGRTPPDAASSPKRTR